MAPTLPWFVLLPPLISAAIIVLFTQKHRDLSAAISVLAVLVSFVAAVCIFILPAAEKASAFTWLDFGDKLQVQIGFTIDRLSRAMLLMVTFVGSLIHIYSLGYMAREDGKSRFFAGLSLFMFSMLGIILANNLVMMFIFWELVGVSSYILIGHWFHRDAPPAAANKAFITNRIGDFGFMLGILMVWAAAGTVGFADLQKAETLKLLTANPAYLTVAALLLFCGAVGKSAQFPLHVWLPDAMEGPTPVSALIHAATMVAAGVFMLTRIFFLIAPSHTAQSVIAWIGIITAVLAALMATQQNDFKRILAYSTLSQLGYMVMSVGLAAPDAAMFHLFTHAFFKALLFLCSGAVLHSLHHEGNIWKMGGLKNQMPVTFLTFLIGMLALTGCPGFSGFFSKDAILAAANAHNSAIFALALATAFLTAFYMFRLYIVAFLGSPRSDAARHGHDGSAAMTVPLIVLAGFSIFTGWPIFMHHFWPVSHAEHGSAAVPIFALLVFVLGSGSAIAIYKNKKEDPIYIPLLANKFYLDEIYATIIRLTQDALAKASAWFDRWIIDGVGVRGLSAGTWGAGFLLRLFQFGNLQAYAFFFGAGVVALLYYIVFR